MDQEERKLRLDELKAQQMANRNTHRLAMLSFGVSLFALVASVVFSTWQLHESTKEFSQSARDTHYTDIVNGLDSSAAAVQTNSMRLLSEFVENRENYRSDKAQQTGALDAIQTLAAFIEDESSVRGFRGLSNFQSPQPIVLSRAAVQLVRLDSNPDLGSHIADLSRANLHGVSLQDFKPAGNLIARGADFRRAALGGLDLSDVDADLSFAYCTCARLGAANFGHADLLGADLSGANLRGADLSNVQNLTAAQLHGAEVGPLTELPYGMKVQNAHKWGVDSATCNTITDHMTGMQAGWGFLHTHPCPTSRRSARHMVFSPPFDGKRRDLVLVCRIRAGKRT